MLSPAPQTDRVRFGRRRPFLTLFLLAIFSNVAGSAFNILYNLLVINTQMLPSQQQIFKNVAIPIYNVIAYPICLAVMLRLLWPLIKMHERLLAGETVPEDELEFCRRRLVQLPVLQVIINLLGWLPGAIYFPLMICWLGGSEHAVMIWGRFLVSVLVTAVYTTAQTFFILEAHLTNNLYPDFFQDARPADVRGVWRIPFFARLIGLWLAVAIMPLVAVIVIVLSIDPQNELLAPAAVVVAALGAGVGGLIFRLVGRDLRAWLHLHTAANARIAREDFDVRIDTKRPDEWGALTDSFNDMASALGRAKEMRETFGQFVGPEARDSIIEQFPGLKVVDRVITVLFVDIRGFTRRCGQETPERVRGLLNRFFTIVQGAIEDRGGWINKLLGDGAMALFGSIKPRPDHADVAIASALDLLVRLDVLNAELTAAAEAPLAVGIGIHTGSALVGCFGGPKRRELTAIGETVNLTQRLEQLTKSLGGPILISEKTRSYLREPANLECLGPHSLPGSNDTMVVYRVLPR